MFAPYSSYSFLLTHMFSNGVKQLNILPPIHELYFLSAGQDILKFMVFPPIV